MDANRRPLRILVFCTGRIDRPRSGGELRIHHLCRELAELGHRVDVESFVVRNHPAGETPFGERMRVRLRHSVRLDMLAVADRLGIVPMTELSAWLRSLRSDAARIAREGRYDIVQFEFPWFARVQDAIAPPARVVYSAHNVEWIWWGRKLKHRICLGRFWRARLLRHERLALKSAHAAVGCSESDCRWLLRNAGNPPRRVVCVPNGYDARRVRPPTAEERTAARKRFGFGENEKIALFVGSNTPPNQQAARALLARGTEWGRDGGARLVIAGRVCAGLKTEPAGSAQLIASQDDLLPLMQAADAGLNPMLSGSGSNLKLIEYCAAGLPVVTTAFGLRGFRDLQPWMRVAEIETFAAAAAQAQRPGVVPEAAMRRYAWSTLAGELSAFYYKIPGG